MTNPAPFEGFAAISGGYAGESWADDPDYIAEVKGDLATEMSNMPAGTVSGLIRAASSRGMEPIEYFRAVIDEAAVSDK